MELYGLLVNINLLDLWIGCGIGIFVNIGFELMLFD